MSFGPTGSTPIASPFFLGIAEEQDTPGRNITIVGMPDRFTLTGKPSSYTITAHPSHFTLRGLP